LGKTGLASFYQKTPNIMFACNIICFILCFAACEWIVNGARYASVDPDRVEKLQNDDNLSDHLEEQATDSNNEVGN